MIIIILNRYHIIASIYFLLTSSRNRLATLGWPQSTFPRTPVDILSLFLHPFHSYTLYYRRTGCIYLCRNNRRRDLSFLGQCLWLYSCSDHALPHWLLLLVPIIIIMRDCRRKKYEDIIINNHNNKWSFLDGWSS